VSGVGCPARCHTAYDKYCGDVVAPALFRWAAGHRRDNISTQVIYKKYVARLAPRTKLHGTDRSLSPGCRDTHVYCSGYLDATMGSETGITGEGPGRAEQSKQRKGVSRNEIHR
jgi:hypothetical protein